MIEEKLLAMVQAVSEDREFNTIEFNEFLVMMSKQKQMAEEIKMEEMMEAVRYVLHVHIYCLHCNSRIAASILIIIFRVFDTDRDGFLTMEDLKKFLTTLGDRMSDKEVQDMVKLVDREKEGIVECEGKMNRNVKFLNIIKILRILYPAV
jgi:Ca2+-binding EF-hand superfamily protein